MNDLFLELLGERIRVRYGEARIREALLEAAPLLVRSPFPDDPIIVYVALTKYSILKLCISYFTGKAAVTLAGAFLGYIVGGLFDSVFLVVGSLVLTIIITAYLFTRETTTEENNHTPEF